MSLFHLAPLVTDSEAFLDRLLSNSALPPFSDSSVIFLDSLRKALVTAENKQYPELIALGFWLRRYVTTLKEQHSERNIYIRKALGTVVHFTPSNVDTMFVYSWVCGLLMGNRNIIRVASADSPIQRRFFEILNVLYEDPAHAQIKQRNVFVKFDRDSMWSAKLSLLADARVLWGGDESVTAIRQMPTKPRSRDISFADRYSVAVINGNELNETNITGVAQGVWRDIEQYEQQACSSPRIIFWFGKDDHYQSFITTLSELAGRTAAYAISRRNEQLVAAQAVVAKYEGKYHFSGPLCVIEPHNFEASILSLHTGHYCLIVADIDSLEDLASSLDRKAQTITHYGFTKQDLLTFLDSVEHNGIDRLVPVGQALEFDHVWDGFDLLESLSRHVSIIV